MAAFPGQSNSSILENMLAGSKRRMSEIGAYVPSPSEVVFLASPYMPDEGGIGTGGPAVTVGGEDMGFFLDAKAIMNDFVHLTSTGHCFFESVTRGIAQKIWVMSNNQKSIYFENLAQSIRNCQNDTEVKALLVNFCKGSPTLSNLGQLLSDAHLAIAANVETINSMTSPVFGFSSKSPWTTFISGTDIPKVNSLTFDERKWLVTPSLSSTSLGREQNLDMSKLEDNVSEATDDTSHLIMDKMNARKKTVTALNRMKQFVVPKTGASDSGSASASPHVSPSIQSMSTLPGVTFNVSRNSYPSLPNIYSMAISHSPKSHITPTTDCNALSAPTSAMVNISPEMAMQESVVCRRKKARISESVGPKGVSKTGSTWRIQVQVRGGVVTDSNGHPTERKKYRFSRYVSDYVEALWMYEVAILLSDRPKDLETQMTNGNYRILLENRVVNSPDHYYMELGVRVSAFAHAERGRDDNSERVLAVQAYDFMKPSNGLSLAELGQSIASLGPVYSTMSKMDISR